MTTRRRDDAVFFLAIPAAIGVVFFLVNGFPARNLPAPLGFLYWVTVLPVFWAVFHLATLGAAWIAQPLQPPFWLVLVVGGVLALPAIRVVYIGYGLLFAPHFSGGVAGLQPVFFEPSLDFAFMVLSQAASFVAFWIGVNCLIDFYVGPTRYRESSTAAESRTAQPAPLKGVELAPGARPAFLQKVPPHLGKEVLALKAEDHYLMVITTQGQGLIHYRLSDAVSELPANAGLRVHRSYWIARRAVARVESRRRVTRLHLSNGLSVPVSHVHKASVLEFWRAQTARP